MPEMVFPNFEYEADPFAGNGNVESCFEKIREIKLNKKKSFGTTVIVGMENTIVHSAQCSDD